MNGAGRHPSTSMSERAVRPSTSSGRTANRRAQGERWQPKEEHRVRGDLSGGICLLNHGLFGKGRLKNPISCESFRLPLSSQQFDQKPRLGIIASSLIEETEERPQLPRRIQPGNRLVPEIQHLTVFIVLGRLGCLPG